MDQTLIINFIYDDFYLVWTQKILFRKLLSDYLTFFFIALISTSIVIWVFQAVNFFDISDALAFPSTYVIDKEGKVRFAYVGSSPSDRPSLKALLKQLDDIVS